MTKLATSKTKRHSKGTKPVPPARNKPGKSAAPADKLDRVDKQLARDRELVRRCVSGDVAGWEEMYKECHPKLLLNIRSLIRPYGHNANLADEIASRVWCSLVGANGTLLGRYDAHRGCKLSTFFAALARYELLEYWRCEKRRREREQAVVRRRVRHRYERTESFHIAWGEFVDTLTRRERDFLEQVLIAPETNAKLPAAVGEHTTANGEHGAANGDQVAGNGKRRVVNGKKNGVAGGKKKANGNGKASDRPQVAESKSSSDSAASELSQSNSWQLRSRVLSKLKRYSDNEQT